MKKQRKILAILILMGIMSPFYLTLMVDYTIYEISPDTLNEPNLSPKTAIAIVIRIDESSDWATYASSGQGTQNYPYIIENRIIDGFVSGDDYPYDCIYINNELSAGGDVYFEIRNCTLIDGAVGLHLVNSQNRGKIYNNTISTFWNKGIQLNDCDLNEIRDNHIFDNTQVADYNSSNGIFLVDSHYNRIENNTIHGLTNGVGLDVSVNGITLWRSDHNNLTDNQIFDLDNLGSSYIRSTNGIYVYEGSSNIIKNNTITNLQGSNLVEQCGNGIYIYESEGTTFSAAYNEVLFNTIAYVSGGNQHWSGNGILLIRADNCEISQNIIYNASAVNDNTKKFSGNGIMCHLTTNTIISENQVSNTSTGGMHSGNGIYGYQTTKTTITQNMVENCYGLGSYSGNGIGMIYQNNHVISNNNITHTVGRASTTTYYDQGNGILVYLSDYSTISSNIITDTSSGAAAAYSGNGIYLDYECDYNTILGNEISNCNGIGGLVSGHGIIGSQDFDMNTIQANVLPTEDISVSWRNAYANMNNNQFIGNIVDQISFGDGDSNLLEDNQVNHLWYSQSRYNTFVGNLNLTRGMTQFHDGTYSMYDNYALKITSPKTSIEYQGTGGLELTYKYQDFGDGLDWLKISIDGTIDYFPRSKGIYYIPWKSDGSHTITLYANYTGKPNFDIHESLPVTFQMKKIGSTTPIVITGNSGPTGLTHYLKLYSTGDGTAMNPYILEPFIIDITNAGSNAIGLTIKNTDAYFILNDSIIAGGIGQYGIKLENVKNARLESNEIIGLPSTYVPGSTSSTSYPLEGGIFLDGNCVNNTLMNNIIFRTSAYGIRIDGDTNTIYQNDLANAYGYGCVIKGDYNLIQSNMINPFGGPDKTDYWYQQGAGISGILSGVQIDGTGSYNTLKQNVVQSYPKVGFLISNILCSENLIISNDISGCTIPIDDSGSNTHLLEVTFPMENTIYTKTDKTNEGYYPGTEGFEDYENMVIPDGWTYASTGEDHTLQIIAEKKDFHFLKHKKILSLYTGLGTNPYLNATRSFDTHISSGTIEFWFMAENSANGVVEFVFKNQSDSMFVIEIDGNQILFQDNETLNNTGIFYQNSGWNRISIDFSNEGGYAGLAPQQYQFRIYNASGEGLLYTSDPANFTTSGICSDIEFFIQGDGTEDLTLYLDAIGYSWGLGYLIGDNTAEGMFISQDAQQGYKDWTWVGYSLNGESLIALPTFGDVVIPLPNSLGTQTLQLVANDSEDYSTTSPIRHFEYYFDRELIIRSHTENGEIVTEYTQITGWGILQMADNVDLNVSVTFKTTIDWIDSYTIAYLYYKVNNLPWTPILFPNFGIGEKETYAIIGADNYILGDTLEYYLGFEQYDLSLNFLQQYYWTQSGVQYFDYLAQEEAFKKRICPVPYQLTLNYSVFYQAEQEIHLITDKGQNVTMIGLCPITQGNFSLDFYNTTNTMENFEVRFTGFASELGHTMEEDTSVIFDSVTPVPLYKEEGIMSPFILPVTIEYSQITIPILLFKTFNSYVEDNKLSYTEYLDLITLDYTGVKYDWFFGHRGLKEFKLFDSDTYACIRFDTLTGIMVYYEYNDLTEDEGKKIYFGLNSNNQSYPINLEIDKRCELSEINQDFVNATLEGILYDPPGDNSYCEISSGTSITLGYSLELQEGTDYQKEYQILFLGFGFETDEYEIDTSGEMYDFEITHTYTETMTTSLDSENPELIGLGGGDLYYGSGMYIMYYYYVDNYYFAVNGSDPVNWNVNDLLVFSIGSHMEYEMTPNTTFNVMGAYLEDTGMYELRGLNFFADNVISGAEERFVEELENSPYFWTPGNVYEFGYSSSTTYTEGLHSYMEMSNDTFFAWSTYLSMSVGGSLGVGAEYAWALSWNLFETSGKIATLNTWSRDFVNYTTTTQEDQILVHFEDDDGVPIGQHDQFKLALYNDTRYGTIGFIIDSPATFTSLPHEYFTGDRKCPTLCELAPIDTYLHGTVNLIAFAEDQEVNEGKENNIFKVEFFYDDEPVFGSDSILIGTQSDLDKSILDDPFTFEVTWDTSSFEGEFYLYARAWDRGSPLSNRLLSSPKWVQIDNTPPELCELIVFGPYIDLITLYVKASDSTSGIAYVEYWIGDPDLNESVYLGSSDLAANAFSFLWVLSQGENYSNPITIYALAFDVAGNSLISQGIEITIGSTTSTTKEPTFSARDWFIIGGVAGIGSIVGVGLLYGIKKGVDIGLKGKFGKK